MRRDEWNEGEEGRKYYDYVNESHLSLLLYSL